MCKQYKKKPYAYNFSCIFHNNNNNNKKSNKYANQFFTLLFRRLTNDLAESKAEVSLLRKQLKDSEKEIERLKQQLRKYVEEVKKAEDLLMNKVSYFIIYWRIYRPISFSKDFIEFFYFKIYN